MYDTDIANMNKTQNLPHMKSQILSQTNFLCICCGPACMLNVSPIDARIYGQQNAQFHALHVKVVFDIVPLGMIFSVHSSCCGCKSGQG